MRDHETWTRAGRMASHKWSTGMTALCLLVFLSVAGTPAWWKSTEIYRAALPFERIRALGRARMVLPIDIYLDTKGHPELFPGMSRQLARALDESGPVHTGPCGVDIKYTVSDAEEASPPEQRRGYTFILERAVPGSREDKEGGITLYSGDSRTFRVVQGEGHDPHSTVDQIASFVEDVVVDRAGLAMQARKASVGKREAPPVTKARERDMVVPINANYDIELTLVVPDPETTPAGWNVGPAVTRFLKPMLQRLEFLGGLETSSQVLHCVSPGVTPKKTKGAEAGRDLVHAELTEFVDNEWPLSSVTGSSLTTPLNFITYVPPRADGRWRVLDRGGHEVPSNGFTIPQWGGVHIVDSVSLREQTCDGDGGDQDACKQAGKDVPQVDMQRSLSIVVTQLRTLLGLGEAGVVETRAAGGARGQVRVIVDADAHRNGVTLVEADRLLRRRLVELVATSSSTIADLANSLEEVEKMAIRDEIAIQVGECLDSLDQARRYLERDGSDAYDKAYACARDALISSELAFFDPTVVKLLYFPDDNKYALYVPLFVPLFATLLSQLKSEKAQIAALFGRR